MSTTSVGMSSVPTGIYNSPDTRYNTFWWVGLNGAADSWMHNDVAYSYVCYNSPRYDISINACSVDNVGDVDYYIDGVSYDSCGALRALVMSMVHIELDLMVIV